jgi:hypothetical protein
VEREIIRASHFPFLPLMITEWLRLGSAWLREEEREEREMCWQLKTPGNCAFRKVVKF